MQLIQRLPLTDGRFTDPFVARHCPIVSIEDGLAEDDWERWALIHHRLGIRLQRVAKDSLLLRIENELGSQATDACSEDRGPPGWR